MKFNHWYVYFIKENKYAYGERGSTMDQIKIGKFIAECRKREKLTQL